MKIKYFVGFIVIGLALVGSAVADVSDIRYPIEELGNCKSKSDCKIYCDKPANNNACLDFAQKNNLMSDEEVLQAKKFLATGGKGPGECNGKDSCEQYCNDIKHIDECISYAEKNNLMSPQELQEAKKVQSAIAKGVKPPACNNKKECDVYCENPDHMEECITFGAAAGFIQGKELEDSQKMLAAIKRGIKPPPCKGKNECDQYCSSPDNMEVCMNFAMEAGFMSEQEKENSQKMLQAIKKGVKPPACRGKEDCDNYCGQEEHFDECVTFAEAAGFMDEKDAKMARKTGGKGPGGCKGRDECDAFCNKPDNQETCFNFAKDNGMIPEEDLKRMEDGKQQMKQSLEQAPSEVLDCLKNEVGADMMEKMKNGVMPQRDIGEKMQTCFQKMGPGPDRENQNSQPGPGEKNPDGQMMPQQSGPGGCKGPEECKAYCESNPDNCKNFQPGQNPPNQNEQENRRGSDRIEGQMPQGQPCQGENCQGPPNQLQPGREFREGQELKEGQPPQNQQEGQQQQQPQQPVPNETPPPPPPPPTSLINTDSLVGSLIYAVFQFLANR